MSGPSELNYDILSLIFFHLSPAQIFRCERVNKAWQAFVQEWAPKHGYEIMVESDPKGMLPTESKDRMSYEMLKNHVKQSYCVETGRLLSASKNSCVHACTIGQGGLAWIKSMEVGRSLLPKPINGLFWRFHNDSEERCIRAKELFSPETTSPVVFDQLAANTKRTILVHLEAESSSHIVTRAAVVSLQSQSIIFKRDYSLALRNSGREREPVNATIPYLLGDSRVYAASWDPKKQKYLLEAYDLCTERKLYTTDVLEQHWLWFNTWRDNLWEGAPIGCKYNRLARTANGNELILELVGARPQSHGVLDATGVKIIAGDNGQCIQIIPAPFGITLLDVFTHPSTKQIVFISRAYIAGEAIFKASDVARTHRFYTIHRFVQTPDGGFAPLPADVLFTPEVPSFKQLGWDLVGFNPLTMTAFVSRFGNVSRYYSHGPLCRRDRDLFGCRLIPTSVPEFYKTAEAVLSYKFEHVKQENCDILATVRQCYLPGELKAFTLPSNTDSHQKETQGACIPRRPGYPFLHEDGSFLCFCFNRGWCYLQFG